MPRNRSQYGVVCSSREYDGDFISPERYFASPFYKEAVNFGGVAAFKSSELLGQHGVEGVSDHGHNYVEVDLDQDGGRKGVKVEKLNGLRDDVFHAPSSGVIADQQLYWCFEIIRDQESGLLMAVAPDDYVSQITLVIRQCDEGFMYQRIGILPFGVGNMDALPGSELLDPAYHVLTSSSEGDKAYPLLIESRELGIGSELGVKDKGRFDPTFDLFPKGEKTHYLIIGLLALNISSRVKNEFGCGILSKEGKCPFHPLAPGSSPVLLQNGFFPKVRDSMEVQVDDIAIVELELIGMLDKALLQAQQMNPIETIGICGNGSALGQDIELSKETRPWIEGMLRDMGVTLSAEKLEGHKREKVAECGDDFGSRQSGLLHHLGQVELFDERGEEENSSSLGVKGLLRNISELGPLSDGRHPGTLNRPSKLKSSSTRQSRIAFFSQNPFDSADRNLHPFFGQKLSNFSGRQAMFSPIADFGPGSGIDTMPSDLTLGYRFGEVDLFVGEEVPEEVYIRHGISETLGDDPGGQSLDEGGPQCLVTALPLMHRIEEEVFVPHDGLIYYVA
jgi:hypothetical protein